jgi:hypothetical protein
MVSTTPSTTGQGKKLLYTVKEIYEERIIPVGMNELYKLVHREDFPALNLGRKILIPIEGLEAWVKTIWQKGIKH